MEVISCSCRGARRAGKDDLLNKLQVCQRPRCQLGRSRPPMVKEPLRMSRRCTLDTDLEQIKDTRARFKRNEVNCRGLSLCTEYVEIPPGRGKLGLDMQIFA